jgi:hypothetical protein
MSAVRNLDDLYRAATAASERVMIEREDAREAAIVAIRGIEARIQEVIAGDSVRGLANLYPASRPVENGMRVVSQEMQHLHDTPVRLGRSALVLDRHGCLSVFDVSSDGAFGSRPVRDDEIQAQDLDAVLHTVGRALARHCERADRTTANYARIVALSDSIVFLLANE